MGRDCLVPASVKDFQRGPTQHQAAPSRRGPHQKSFTEWDIDSLAFYSHTELGGGYLKTRVYYNRFDNLLSAWDHSTQSSQTVGRAFNSHYNDRSWGASVEAGVDLGPANTLRGALHYRRDRHISLQCNSPDGANTFDSVETSDEKTISVAQKIPGQCARI